MRERLVHPQCSENASENIAASTMVSDSCHLNFLALVPLNNVAELCGNVYIERLDLWKTSLLSILCREVHPLNGAAKKCALCGRWCVEFCVLGDRVFRFCCPRRYDVIVCVYVAIDNTSVAIYLENILHTVPLNSGE